MSHPPIESSITFFYTHDLDTSAQFYEDVLGLELWLDQGSCRIYQVSGDGYVGLCQTSETKTPPVDKRSHVIFTLYLIPPVEKLLGMLVWMVKQG